MYHLQTDNDKTVTLHFEVHFQKMPEFSQELTNFPLNFGETYQKKKSKEFSMLKEKEHECQRSHVVKKKNTLKSTKTWLNVLDE